MFFSRCTLSSSPSSPFNGCRTAAMGGDGRGKNMHTNRGRFLTMTIEKILSPLKRRDDLLFNDEDCVVDCNKQKVDDLEEPSNNSNDICTIATIATTTTTNNDDDDEEEEEEEDKMVATTKVTTSSTYDQHADSMNLSVIGKYLEEVSQLSATTAIMTTAVINTHSMFRVNTSPDGFDGIINTGDKVVSICKVAMASPKTAQQRQPYVIIRFLPNVNPNPLFFQSNQRSLLTTKTMQLDQKLMKIDGTSTTSTAPTTLTIAPATTAKIIQQQQFKSLNVGLAMESCMIMRPVQPCNNNNNGRSIILSITIAFRPSIVGNMSVQKQKLKSLNVGLAMASCMSLDSLHLYNYNNNNKFFTTAFRPSIVRNKTVNGGRCRHSVHCVLALRATFLMLYSVLFVMFPSVRLVNCCRIEEVLLLKDHPKNQQQNKQEEVDDDDDDQVTTTTASTEDDQVSTTTANTEDPIVLESDPSDLDSVEKDAADKVEKTTTTCTTKYRDFKIFMPRPLVVRSTDTNSNYHADSMGKWNIFSFPALAFMPIDRCLSKIARHGRLIRGITTNGRGTVFLYGGNGIECTSCCIPDGLRDALLPPSSSLPSSTRKPFYVSLGTPAAEAAAAPATMPTTHEQKKVPMKDRYFAAFDDGTYAYEGPETMSQRLDNIKAENKNKNVHPRSIAFGVSYDTYFVIFNDGSSLYDGSGIPAGLLKVLNDLDDDNHSDLSCVKLGPSGEWFLRTMDCRVWWGNVSHKMDDAMRGLVEDGHHIMLVDFGKNGSYFISYN